MRSQSICLNILFDRNLIKIVKINRFFSQLSIIFNMTLLFTFNKPGGPNSFFLKTCFVTLSHLTTHSERNISLLKTHHWVFTLVIDFRLCFSIVSRSKKVVDRDADISIPLLEDPRPPAPGLPSLVQHQQTQGREEIDNDIIYNVDHVCVKPDDGMRQINIKIFYKYTQPEYPRASQHQPARRSWSQSSVRSVCWARAVF